MNETNLRSREALLEALRRIQGIVAFAEGSAAKEVRSIAHEVLAPTPEEYDAVFAK